jgi:hypothetical protein
MSPILRPITGTWTLPNGGNPGRSVLTLTLTSPDYVTATVFVPDVVRVTVDADGDVVPVAGYQGLTVEVDGKDRAVIWASEEGSVQATYRAALEGAQARDDLGEYLIPDVEEPITLQEILELGVPSSSPQYLTIQSYIDSLTIAPAFGQASRITTGAVTVPQVNTYVLASPTPTLDPISTDVELGVAGMALKYTGEFTRAFQVYASADVADGNNKTFGLRLAKNGTTIPQSECRAFSGAGANEAKLVTSWILELAEGDEVQVYLANHTDGTAFDLRRGRIIATSISGFTAP